MTTTQVWTPQFSKWPPGGWCVNNVRWPGGGVGCVSRNYPDGKWRIVCDRRPFDTAPTFKNRDEAARAEREYVKTLPTGQTAWLDEREV